MVWAAVVGLAGMASLGVRFSHNAMNWLPKDSTVRVGTRLMDGRNGGTVMLEVIVDSGRENGLHDPDLLAVWPRRATGSNGCRSKNIRAGKVMSLADVLKETNRALNQGHDAAYTVPDNRRLIAQELILFESSGSDDLEDLVDATYRTGRYRSWPLLPIRSWYKDYVEKIKAYLKQQFPHETISLTGHMALFIGITKLFITSMAKSYLFALLVITCLDGGHDRAAAHRTDEHDRQCRANHPDFWYHGNHEYSRRPDDHSHRQYRPGAGC